MSTTASPGASTANATAHATASPGAPTANATAHSTASPGASTANANATASATTTVNSTSTTTPPPSKSDSPSTSSPPPSTSPPPPPRKLTGVYVGITVGAVVIILVLIILCVYYWKKKRVPKDNSYGSSLDHQELPKPPPPTAGPHMLPVVTQSALGHTVGKITDTPEVRPSRSSPPSTGGQHPPQPPDYVRKRRSNFTREVDEAIKTGSGGGNTVPAGPSPGIALGISLITFTYKDLECATDSFSDANFLGEGGFGHVHKGLLPDGKEVAVKQLKAGSSQGEREFQAEIKTISGIRHKHLVYLVGYCIDDTHRLLVYEFVPNNTLHFHLHGEGRPPMDWATRLKIALGAAKGLAYLHEDCRPKIIYRDIKAANILLDFNFEAKVADFGLARFGSDINTYISTRVMGTFGYLAPEYATSGKPTEESDVFSFGVILLELITGRIPVNHSSNDTFTGLLVEWAIPLLRHALEYRNFDPLVDPRLQKEYNPNEMARMVACAAASIQYSPMHRPRMSQIFRALEGDTSNGIRLGDRMLHNSHGGFEYDTAKYKQDMTMLWQYGIHDHSK